MAKTHFLDLLKFVKILIFFSRLFKDIFLLKILRFDVEGSNAIEIETGFFIEL